MYDLRKSSKCSVCLVTIVKTTIVFYMRLDILGPAFSEASSFAY